MNGDEDEAGKYEKEQIKIRFESDDNLPLNKTQNFII